MIFFWIFIGMIVTSVAFYLSPASPETWSSLNAAGIVAAIYILVLLLYTLRYPIPVKQRIIVGALSLICSVALFSHWTGTQKTTLWQQQRLQNMHESGIKEFHMRIACPPLAFPCEYLNFGRSRSNLDLATHTAVKEPTGSEGLDMKDYSDPDNEKYKAMVEQIKKRLDFTSLHYQRLNDLVDAIGLPKEKLCTHCWDGSSYF